MHVYVKMWMLCTIWQAVRMFVNTRGATGAQTNLNLSEPLLEALLLSAVASFYTGVITVHLFQTVVPWSDIHL